MQLLEPGESQVIDISFPLKNTASYSEALAAWVLLPGKYYIEVGRNSRDYETCAAVEVEKTVVLEQLRNLRKFDPQKLSSVLGRVGNPDTWPKPDNVPVLKLDCDSIETQTHVYTDEDRFDTPAPADFVTMQDVLSGKHTVEELAAQLSVEELAKLCVGRFGDQSTIGAAGDAVPGAAGQTIDSLWAERGIGSLVLADGPAGLRLTKHFRTDKDGKILSSGGFFAMFGGKEEAEAKSSAPAARTTADPSSQQNLEDFVLYISKKLVDYPDEVKVRTASAENGSVIQITCRPGDRGKIIGKSGKTIMALRALVSGAAGRTKGRVSVEVLDDEVEAAGA